MFSLKTTVATCATLIITSASFSSASAFTLKGTAFESEGNRVGLNPTLLYSIALAESASASSNKYVKPNCLAIRGSKAHYPKTKDEAKTILDRLIPIRPSTDIGCMQVNWKWHGQRVSSPYDLLDPNINIRVAADILRDAIKSHPDNQILAIGRYHHWNIATDEGYNRAYNYGRRVLEIWTNLTLLSN